MHHVNNTMHSSEDHGMKLACVGITPTSDTGELYKTLNKLVDYPVFQFLGLWRIITILPGLMWGLNDDRENKSNRLQGTYRCTVPRTETGQYAV